MDIEPETSSTSTTMDSRSIKGLSRLFLKLMKSCYSEFVWSKLASGLPIPAEEEYQNVKKKLINMSLQEDDDAEHMIIMTASQVFGKTMTEIIKNKFESIPLINTVYNNDSDYILENYNSSELTDSSQIL